MIKGYHQVIHKMYAMRLISKSGAVCHLKFYVLVVIVLIQVYNCEIRHHSAIRRC